jgi:hypothetical protein
MTTQPKRPLNTPRSSRSTAHHRFLILRLLLDLIWDQGDAAKLSWLIIFRSKSTLHHAVSRRSHYVTKPSNMRTYIGTHDIIDTLQEAVADAVLLETQHLNVELGDGSFGRGPITLLCGGAEEQIYLRFIDFDRLLQSLNGSLKLRSLVLRHDDDKQPFRIRTRS